MPKEVIEAAKNGELVLFCGAGISTENKTVLPFSFYEEVQDELNVKDNNLSFSELMQLYCDKPDGRVKLIKKIKNRFNYIHSFPEIENLATRFHKELAEQYYIRTIITTNWDTYFESYCAATPIVTPADYRVWDENDRSVLKIHGSISNIGSIIATQDDYEICAKNLEKGIIGSELKRLLAKKIVVFIGQCHLVKSFRDMMDSDLRLVKLWILRIRSFSFFMSYLQYMIRIFPSRRKDNFCFQKKLPSSFCFG